MKKSIFSNIYVLIAASFLWMPSMAFAHAHLVKSSPMKGSVVHKDPKEITLNFSEDLELALCKVEVKDLKTGVIINRGKPTNFEGKKNTLQADLDSLKPGKSEYEVSWKVVSTDSHKMSGKFSFTYAPDSK